ncbi:MAG TPA: ferredoxin--NADP reductase [Streptosporangiaceae bacterium]|nr:ferredoxin--NADP reductase [Streptosporangiaceae bacterium]
MTAGADRAFHQLRVQAVIPETAEACSLVFEVPSELAAAFAYRPGQFLTLRIPSDRDGSVARCYSLCSSPLTGDPLTVTVKQTPGGYASHWIAANVGPGTVLDVLPPAGMFVPSSLDDDYLLLAAGSGITPVMSILKSVLAAGSGRVVLVYANRDERSVIFGQALKELAPRAGSRLLVVHWLDVLQGLPSGPQLVPLIGPFRACQIYASGPDPFLAAVREAASAIGVPPRGVRVERFLSLQHNPFDTAPPVAAGVAAALEVTIDGETRSLPWPAGIRMLDVLIDAELDPPFSCRDGICGACACQLTGGKVEMINNEVLDEADLADGYVLACQSVALTPEVSVSYD